MTTRTLPSPLFLPDWATTGVYSLRHLPSGRRFIGKSHNLLFRMAYQARQLADGNHPNARMRADKATGDFVAEILEYCPMDAMPDREAFWVARYGTLDPAKGYNVLRQAGRPPSERQEGSADVPEAPAIDKRSREYRLQIGRSEQKAVVETPATRVSLWKGVERRKPGVMVLTHVASGRKFFLGSDDLRRGARELVSLLEGGAFCEGSLLQAAWDLDGPEAFTLGVAAETVGGVVPARVRELIALHGTHNPAKGFNQPMLTPQVL